MSIERNMRRLEKKSIRKRHPLPTPNYDIAHKKARKHGTGVKYHQRAGAVEIIPGGLDYRKKDDDILV